jgi:hypothetical protein
MYTCGYVCPSCEGKGFMDDGNPCYWCQPLPERKDSTSEINIDAEEDN